MRQSFPFAVSSTPVTVRSNACSDSVGFTTATVRARRSSVQAAATSSGKVGLPAFSFGCSPPTGNLGGGGGESPATSTGTEPK